MAAWDGYFSLGGVEIANLERFLSYVESIGQTLPVVDDRLDEVRGTHTTFGDNPYTTPVDDRAPWVDLDDPVTQRFLGMQILSVDGIDESTKTASTTESLGKGGTVGVDRDGSREMRFTGLLVGLDAEAVQAGITWLERALWQRSRNARPIVPQQQGVSDLRFFEQKPNPILQVVNRVQNPEATGLGESLVGTDGTAYAFRALVDDDWAYKVIARTVDEAEAQLRPDERAFAVPGQQWMARAILWRDAAVVGPRLLRLYLRFRDQYGNLVESVGRDATTVPDGILHRWTDARYDSTSQRLTPAGMMTNFIVNPSAEGKRLGLVQFRESPTVASLISSTKFQGKRAYLVRANTTAEATVASAPAPALAGQQWWGRARARVAAAWGARHLRSSLRFLDAAGRQVGLFQGTRADQAPAGTVRHWTGERFASTSDELTGDTKRTNYNTNPIPRKALNGYSAGGGATIALERFTGLGTPYAIRVEMGAGDLPAAGLNIDFTRPAAGTVLHVTFWALGVPTLALYGRGYTLEDETGDPVAGIPFDISTSVPTQVSIAIKITTPTDFQLRIGRRNGANGVLRITRIGLLTGSDVYFDGDTGTYEAENPNDPYTSAIAHLPGAFDLYDGLWNTSFRKSIEHWSAPAGLALTWDRTGKRLTTRATADQASGKILAAHDEWPYIGGGQRISGAMKVFNLSSAAVSVAVRIRPSGGQEIDGATVVVPANGEAWVSVPRTPMPSGTNGAGIRLVAKGTIPSGTVLQVDKVWMGTVPSGADFTEAMWFDTTTASTNGPAYDDSEFEFEVGAVAPDGTASVQLLLSRLRQGPVLAADAFIVDQVMLTQYDAVGTDVTDGAPAPVPTMPDYFDGDTPSTFQTIANASVETGADGVADTTAYELIVAAEVPAGAMTAEIAVSRDDEGAAATDVIYADGLMLAEYDPAVGIPEYTPITRQQVISEVERRFQDVYATAGPTSISSMSLGPEGCNGAAATVEFTLVAENPTRLRDPGAVVPLPLPTDVVLGDRGAGSFDKLEDRDGIVKNYMPQFPPYSPLIPTSWVTTAQAGTVTAVGMKPNSVYPYYLRIRQGSATSVGRVTISALNALGEAGGYDSAVASVWLGGTVAGKKVDVAVRTMSGQTILNTTRATFTVPDTSGLIFDEAHRVNIVLPDTGGLADGFAFLITTEAGFGDAYVGNPQVTLGATPFPQINAALPDDGTYTFTTDGSGYSMRVPVAQIESATIFPNLTAPPTAIASLGGYDEVGLTTFRTFAEIPADIIPRNAAAVPIARVDFDRFISRWVRFRFYPNPQNRAPENIPTWSYEHEWVIDQFNGNIDRYGQAGYMSIVVDGVAQRVWLRAWDGTVLPGDQYVVTGDGGPIGWPEFRDIPWVVSVDYPTFRQSSSAPVDDGWWRASLALMIEE